MRRSIYAVSVWEETFSAHRQRINTLKALFTNDDKKSAATSQNENLGFVVALSLVWRSWLDEKTSRCH